MEAQEMQMEKFSLAVYEDMCGCPTVHVEADVIALAFGKGVANIDAEAIKRNILETLKLQAITLRKPEAVS